MRVKKSVTIKHNDLVRLLMEKLDIKAHLTDIDCSVGTDDSGSLETITLEWTEGHELSETWNR